MREANPLNKKLIRGFRTNIVLYGFCFAIFVAATASVAPVLALVEGLIAALVLYPAQRAAVL